MGIVDAWSFSRFDSWRTCPKQFHAKFVSKVIKDDAKTPAMQRGTDLHEHAASYLSGKRDTLPPGKAIEKFATMFGQLRDLPDKVVEQQWAFDRNWKATGWFAKGRNAAWLRVVLDAGVVYPDDTADVVDHKTGKKYGSNDDQMELFGLASFAFWPWVKQVTTRLWYLDEGSEDIAEFDSRDYNKLVDKWEGMIKPMFEDTTFAALPNDKCRFCPLAKSNHDGRANLPRCQFG